MKPKSHPTAGTEPVRSAPVQNTTLNLDQFWGERSRRYDKPHAWVLENVQRADRPVPYKHPMGAVIWVTLPSGCLRTARLSSTATKRTNP